ncbi:MAG: TetR/AcrR family transcriptional regulator [Solirubrobacteraceae bacterium]|nr:TetR/AcrR family transcriptional regulator [Solirubrobacteraceae bacterium]
MSAAERREQLLDVALEILCDQGAEALSIDAIAKGAGITRPVVYTQFGDLPGLLHALVEREEAKVLQQLAKAIPVSVGEVEPDDVIVNAIAAFLAAVAERPRTWQIVLTPPQGMPRSLHDKVVERREAVVEQITPLIAWGVTKRGGPAGLDHRLLGRIILVLAEEAGRLVITKPDQFPPELLVEQSRVLVSSLSTEGLAGVAATPGSVGTPPSEETGLRVAEAAAGATGAAKTEPKADVEGESSGSPKPKARAKSSSRSRSRKA